MEFAEMLKHITSRVHAHDFINATISQPRLKSSAIKRIKLKPITIRNEYMIQAEYQYERILKHENITASQFDDKIAMYFAQFKQAQIRFTEEQVHVQLSKKNKVLWKATPAQKTIANLTHNRQKKYLLDEHKIHPFLVRLGVQTTDGKIKQQKYDKFKQINRFLEFIDDTLHHLPQDRTIRILDFGSGKSYLTFALYHYLKIEKGLDIHVTGLDLKKEVIEECQQIAQDLHYDQLEFLVGDINDYNEATTIDMVVTLHACDVATDMALARAVRWGAKVILSVPCCQHELNRQLQAPTLDIMLQHGLVKERFAALATDSIRAEILGLVGYDAQLLEFIDMAHTPKNILIRAYHTGKQPSLQQRERYEAFITLLHAEPFLAKELQL